MAGSSEVLGGGGNTYLNSYFTGNEIEDDLIPIHRAKIHRGL